MSLGVFFTADPSTLRTEAAKQAGYFVGLAFNAGIGAVLQNYGMAQVGERVVMKMRDDQFTAMVRREISFFDMKENSVGEITTRLANDARSIAKATGAAAAQQVQAYSCLLIGVIVAFTACWKIALVVMGALIPMVLAGGIKMAAYSGQLDHLLFKPDEDADSENTLIATAFTNMRTVSAFSVQFRVAELYNKKTRSRVPKYEKKAWVIGFAK